MIRFYRSIITTAGITLGIAFLVSVWTTAEVDFKIKEGSGQRQEIILGDEDVWALRNGYNAGTFKNFLFGRYKCFAEKYELVKSISQD